MECASNDCIQMACTLSQFTMENHVAFFAERLKGMPSHLTNTYSFAFEESSFISLLLKSFSPHKKHTKMFTHNLVLYIYYPLLICGWLAYSS